ncbi:MAG: nucleotide sugar dehydrogenase [Acidobacteriota bacterium]|nr:nucleotide sugar dehydrogenase [Acidobacteriota bacterium]
MKIAVFGLGYVGCVSAACLAELGHDVVGVDVNPDKVSAIAEGRAPMIERGLNELLTKVVHAGSLRATSNPREALTGADAALICVGTPSRANGSLDADHLETVASEIGASLSRAAAFPVVMVRSTAMPDVVRGRVLAAIEKASGGRAGEQFGFCVNPEFLRESTAIADFFDPPFTLIGEADAKSGDRAAAVYAGLTAPVIRMPLEAASMVKYASNIYHALKIAFANEVGTLCHRLGIDGQAVMEAFAQDDKLNISKAYLRPGFAFGGSCLPKDLRAIIYEARHADVDLPLLASIFPSNEVHLQRAIDLVVQAGKRKVGMIGLSFKPGTDDLRESPLVRLVEYLVGKGYDVRIYDEEVSLSSIFGANREFIEKTLPHLASETCDSIDELLAHAETVVVGKLAPELHEKLAARPDITVVDLGPLAATAPRGALGAVRRVC